MKRILKRLSPYLGRGEHLLYMMQQMQNAEKRGWKRTANFLRNRIYVKHACDISQRARIGQGLKLPHPIGVVIGEGAQIGNFVTIYHNVTIGRKRMEKPEYPVIGDHAVVYCGALIVGNVTVGHHSIVQAYSIVDQDVPPDSIHCANGAVKPLRGAKSAGRDASGGMNA